MADHIKRMNYFDSQVLGKEEFVLEQKYHTRMRQLHNRHLHEPGIAWGLEVEKGSQPGIVVIRPGVAVDRHFNRERGEESSREVVVSEDTLVDLGHMIYPPGAELYLWISYKEEMADRVYAKGGTNPIHWQQTAQVGHFTQKPKDPDLFILLARVKLDSDRNVESVYDTNSDGTPLRLYAGLKGESMESEGLVFLDRITGSETARMEGETRPDLTKGLSVTADTLRCAGELKLSDGAAVSEFSTDITLSGNSDEVVPTQQAVKRFVDGRFTDPGIAPVSSTLQGGIYYVDSANPPGVQAGCYGVMGDLVTLPNDTGSSNWADLYGDTSNPIPGIWYGILLDSLGNRKTCALTGKSKGPGMVITTVFSGIFYTSTNIGPSGQNWISGNLVHIQGYASAGLADGIYQVDTVPSATSFTLRYTTPISSALSGQVTAYKNSDQTDVGSDNDIAYTFDVSLPFNYTYQGHSSPFFSSHRAVGAFFLNADSTISRYRVLSFGEGIGLRSGTYLFSRGLVSYNMPATHNVYYEIPDMKIILHGFQGVYRIGVTSKADLVTEPTESMLWNSVSDLQDMEFQIRGAAGSVELETREQFDGRQGRIPLLSIYDDIYISSNLASYALYACQSEWSPVNATATLRGVSLYIRV